MLRKAKPPAEGMAAATARSSPQPPGATARAGHAELRGSPRRLFAARSLLVSVTLGGLGVTKRQRGRRGYPQGVRHGATCTCARCQRCLQQPGKRQTKPAAAALPHRSPHPAHLAANPPPETPHAPGPASVSPLLKRNPRHDTKISRDSKFSWAPADSRRLMLLLQTLPCL